MQPRRRALGVALCPLAILLAAAGGAAESTPAAPAGTEFLANGGVEDDGAWESYNCGSASLPKVNEKSAQDRHTGTYSRHVVIATGPQEWPGVRSASFPTATGHSYRVRFWYKTLSGAFSVMLRNGAGTDYARFTPDTFAPNYLVLDAARRELVWREFSGVYTEQNGGNGAYLCFTAVGPANEFYLDDVSVTEVDLSSATVVRQWGERFPGQGYVCWARSPWAGLTRLQAPPDGVTACRGLTLALGVNEYESASFVLTNLAEHAVEFAIAVTAAGLPVTLRQALWVTTHSGNEVNDALPLLEGPLSVPAGESREVWLTLCTRGLEPGTYHPQVRITSPGQPPATIDLTVRVYPVALPDDKPIYTCYWEYLVPEWTTPEVAQALVDDLKQHYVNTPVVHPWSLRLQLDAEGRPKADFTELDRVLAYYQQLKPKMVLLNLLADIYLEKMPGFAGEAWKAHFRSWLNGLVNHLREKGLGYGQYALYPYDERLDQPVCDLARLIKETDPRILVYVNHTGTRAQAAAIAPYVDIWCPFLYDFLNLAPYAPSPEKDLDPAVLSKNPRFFWTYANPRSGLPQECSPYADYRLAVWRAWQAGMGGFGYWIYSYKSHWNSRAHEDGETWAVVYLATAPDALPGLSPRERVIPSKRWEATREGVEDYVYLRLLQDRVQQVDGKAPPAWLGEAQAILAESPSAVLADPGNPRLADAAKEKVLDLLSRAVPKP